MYMSDNSSIGDCPKRQGHSPSHSSAFAGQEAVALEEFAAATATEAVEGGEGRRREEAQDSHAGR